MKQTYRWVFLSIIFGGPLFGYPSRETRNQDVISNRSTGIRVLLAKGLNEASFSSTQQAIFYRPQGSGSWMRLGNKVSVSRSGRTLFLNNRAISGSEVALASGSLSSPLRFQSDYIKGVVTISAAADGISVVHAVPLDDYLVGTVSAEMSPSWNVEALKAQTVASRTYAMYMRNHPRSNLYDVERGQEDQVYLSPVGNVSRVQDAVNNTRGIYLTETGAPIKAFFHSRCGGRTDSAHLVWAGGNKKLPRVMVNCPYCQKNPFHWSATFSLQELAARLRLRDILLSPVRILTRRLLPSGRLGEVAVLGSTGEYKFTTEELRNRLGYERLKSAWFKTSVDERGVTFDGVGVGHGVGMCQWGARYLGEEGTPYTKILAHYYPNSRLMRATN